MTFVSSARDYLRKKEKKDKILTIYSRSLVRNTHNSIACYYPSTTVYHPAPKTISMYFIVAVVLKWAMQWWFAYRNTHARQMKAVQHIREQACHSNDSKIAWNWISQNALVLLLNAVKHTNVEAGLSLMKSNIAETGMGILLTSKDPLSRPVQ